MHKSEIENRMQKFEKRIRGKNFKKSAAGIEIKQSKSRKKWKTKSKHNFVIWPIFKTVTKKKTKFALRPKFE